MLHRGKHHNPHLQNAWNLYGEENFIFFVLHRFSTIEEAINCEQNYLDQFVGKKYCYNASQDTESIMLGRKHSIKTKIKISQSKLGAKPSQITRIKMSKSRIGRKCPWNSERLKKQLGPLNPNYKGDYIRLENIDTGKIIEGWGISNVSKIIGTDRSSLGRIIRGQRKSHKRWRVK